MIDTENEFLSIFVDHFTFSRSTDLDHLPSLIGLLDSANILVTSCILDIDPLSDEYVTDVFSYLRVVFLLCVHCLCCEDAF